MRARFWVSMLMASAVLISATPAHAGVVRRGSENIEVGWPGSYFFSRTESEFRAQGCKDPSQLASKGWDAAIIDVEPAHVLAIDKSGSFDSINVGWYDAECDFKGGEVWVSIPTGKTYYETIPRNVQWAVLTFNYGYDINVDWKLCSASCG